MVAAARSFLRRARGVGRRRRHVQPPWAAAGRRVRVAGRDSAGDAPPFHPAHPPSACSHPTLQPYARPHLHVPTHPPPHPPSASAQASTQLPPSPSPSPSPLASSPRAAGTAPCRAARLPCRVGERQRLGGGGGGERIRTSAAASRRAGGGGGGAGGGGAERRGRHRGVAPVRGAAGPALVQGSQDRRPPVLTCACAPCATCGVWRGPVRGPTPRGCGSHALW